MGLFKQYTVELLSPVRGDLLKIKSVLRGMKPQAGEFVLDRFDPSLSLVEALERCPKGRLKFGPIVSCEACFSMMLDAYCGNSALKLHQYGEGGLFRQLMRYFPGLEIRGFVMDDYWFEIIVSGEKIDSHSPARIPVPAFPVQGFENSAVLDLLRLSPEEDWDEFTHLHGNKAFVAEWLFAFVFKAGMLMVAHQPHDLTACALRRILALEPELPLLWIETEDCELEAVSLPHGVARFGRTSDLKLLLEAGVPAEASDSWPNDEAKEGESFDRVLHAAVRQGRVRNAQLLSESGAQVDTPGQNGNTPLHYAVERESATLVQMLLRAGHRLDCINEDGDSPASLAGPELSRYLNPSSQKN